MSPLSGYIPLLQFDTLIKVSSSLNAKLAFYKKSQMCELFIVTEIRKPRVI